MPKKRHVSYIDSTELEDLFDCVILCARGRYPFDHIRLQETLQSLDQDLNMFLHTERMHDLENVAHKRAEDLRRAPADLLEYDQYLDREDAFWESARKFYLAKYNLSQHTEDRELWAVVGRAAVYQEFSLGQKENKSYNIREFVTYIVSTLQWWLRQMKDQKQTEPVELIYRNTDACLPLLLKFTHPSERERLSGILHKVSMSGIVRCLKPHSGTHKIAYPAIAQQIDREIGYSNTSQEAILKALERGKRTPSVFDHLFS